MAAKPKTLTQVSHEFDAKNVVVSLAIQQLTKVIGDNTSALQRLASQLEDLKVESLSRLDRVESHLDGVESRLDRVESRLESVELRIVKIEIEMADIKQRIIRLEGGVSELKGMIERQGERLDSVEQFLREGLGELIRETLKAELDRRRDERMKEMRSVIREEFQRGKEGGQE